MVEHEEAAAAELDEQLEEPLADQRPGHHHQDAQVGAHGEQGLHDQPRLDGLAQADLIGEQEAHLAVGKHPAGGDELVRQRAHPRARQPDHPAADPPGCIAPVQQLLARSEAQGPPGLARQLRPRGGEGRPQVMQAGGD